MRTKRRLLYLIAPTDDEISGAVAEEFLPDVRDLLGSTGRGDDRTTRITTPKGGTRVANRLLAVTPEASLDQA